MWRAGRRVSHHHHISAHRLDVLGRVDERLSLGETGGTGGEVLGVGGKPLGGQAEAGARPGRVLEEEVEDDASLQRGNLLAAPRRYLGERLGRVQNGHDLSGGQVLQSQQVLSGPA